MKTFVLMTKLSSDLVKDPAKREETGKAWLEVVKEKCPEVKFICHYALLGNYDFMAIYEAPDEEIAAKVSLISLSHGANTAESWTAIPYKRYIELTREL